MLGRGGNAMDGALATAIALTVVEPTSNGAGGDGFAQVWDGHRLHGFNGSGRSPAGWSRARFAGLPDMPKRGWESVTVPGAVDLWVQLSERFGKLPFAQLFEPAIHYARYGFPVGPVTASAWESQAALSGEPGFAETFLPGGRAPRAGEPFSNMPLATALEDIAATRGESFYRGALAKRIIASARDAGSALTEDDLAAHRGFFVDPISVGYRDYRVHELPPNGQGVAALIAFGILDRFPVHSHSVDGLDWHHLQIEAMRRGFSYAHRHVGDPAAMECSSEALLAPEFLELLARGIHLERVREHRRVRLLDGGTVYLAVGDAQGMMVSLIQSNYRGFGSGVVVPKTGIALHNRGSGFTLESGHPNCVGPRKRPFHTIIPGFLTRGGRPICAFGVMGAHMQPQGHVQVLSRILDHGQNPQTALDAPRWYLTEFGEIALESGFDPIVASGLSDRGHILHQGDTGLIFGGGQLVWKLDAGYCAASDPRKEGQAVGF